MKIFKVIIDNNPGAWKQGGDTSVLVLAKSPEEAIEKVKNNGWNERFDFHPEPSRLVYGETSQKLQNIYFNTGALFSAYEIVFEGYEVVIGKQAIRKEKLKNISKI
jgi:hypothetical protein